MDATAISRLVCSLYFFAYIDVRGCDNRPLRMRVAEGRCGKYLSSADVANNRCCARATCVDVDTSRPGECCSLAAVDVRGGSECSSRADVRGCSECFSRVNSTNRCRACTTRADIDAGSSGECPSLAAVEARGCDECLSRADVDVRGCGECLSRADAVNRCRACTTRADIDAVVVADALRSPLLFTMDGAGSPSTPTLSVRDAVCTPRVPQ